MSGRVEFDPSVLGRGGGRQTVTVPAIRRSGADALHLARVGGSAMTDAAHAFVAALETAGFGIVFPDEARVPAEWLAALLTVLDPVEADRLDTVGKAATYDRAISVVRNLKGV